MRKHIVILLSLLIVNIASASSKTNISAATKSGEPVAMKNETTSQKKNEPIKVSCIGNSITFGTGLKNPEVDSYPAVLQRLLGDGYNVGRFGKPGATLLNKAFRPYMQQEEFKQAMDFKGDIAVIHLGINDTDPRAWPNYRDDFVGDYLALIDSVRKANPKCRIIIARLTPLSDRHWRFISGTRDWHDQIQEQIELVAQLAGAELIDFFEPLHPRTELFPDAIHPNKDGYDMMAHIVYSAITGNYGGLQLPPYYTNNMVLPRNTAFDIKGKADAGEKIELTIEKPDSKNNKKQHRVQSATATANNRGEWSISVKPLEQGGPYILTAKAKSRTIELQNVMAGELWLCSGQSNMYFPLRDATTGKEDILKADNPAIRLLNIQPRWFTDNITWSKDALDSINRLQYYHDAEWTECKSWNVAQFSAIGYHFARELQDSLGCPIGIIGNAVGGSGIESWIDRTTVEYEFPELLKDWTHNDLIQDWVRGRAEKNMGEGHDKLQRHPYQPCYLYEASIAKLKHLPIKGVIWYQGESNAHCVESHERMFHLLLESWRKTWSNDDMPFYYVQLSSLNRPSWTWFRDSQRKLQNSEKHVGMVVSSDLGDSLDVHPRNKRPIGHRLACLALNDTYNHKNTIPSGPEPKRALVTNGGKKVIVEFDNADGLKTADGKTPITFEIAEHEGIFFNARAEIVSNTVILNCPEVRNPKIVRYGWQPFTRANLTNGADFPASTFRMSIENEHK